MILALLAGALALASGCASQLRVVHGSETPDLVPVEETATWISYTKTQAWDGAKKLCVRTVSAKPAFLPSGRRYYVGVDAARLADTEFSLELTEAGSLKKVSLNSDPQGDETLKAAGELAKNLASAVATVAPLALARAPLERERAQAEQLAEAECPASVSVELVPLRCVDATAPESERTGCPAAAAPF